MSPIDPSNYDSVVASINSKYGKALKKGSEIENPERLSTGSLEMDVSMGGGVPIGRVTRLAGPYSSGKSLTGWSIIRSAQELGMKCVYYNVEKQYTPEFVESRGVDIDELGVVDVTTIEAIAETCESLLGVAHVHIIDSTKAAVSEEVLAASVRDWRPGIEARTWGKAFAFLNDKMDYNENVIVLIDQVRVKNFQSGAEEPAGGKVLDHASSMTFVYRKGAWLHYDAEGYLSDKKEVKAERNSDGQMIPAGRIIQGRVEKSRVSRPLLPATMWLDLNTNEFDRIFELKKHGLNTGILTRAGSYYYYHPEEGGEKVSVGQGEKAVRSFLTSDITAQEQIRDKALKIARQV